MGRKRRRGSSENYFTHSFVLSLNVNNIYVQTRLQLLLFFCSSFRCLRTSISDLVAQIGPWFSRPPWPSLLPYRVHHSQSTHIFVGSLQALYPRLRVRQLASVTWFSSQVACKLYLWYGWWSLGRKLRTIGTAAESSDVETWQ